MYFPLVHKCGCSRFLSCFVQIKPTNWMRYIRSKRFVCCQNLFADGNYISLFCTKHICHIANMSISNQYQRLLCCQDSFDVGNWVGRVTAVPGEDGLHGDAGEHGSDDGDAEKKKNAKSGWPTLRRTRGWDWRRQSDVSMLLPLSVSRGKGRERRWTWSPPSALSPIVTPATWTVADFPAVFFNICSFDICHETKLTNTKSKLWK